MTERSRVVSALLFCAFAVALVAPAATAAPADAPLGDRSILDDAATTTSHELALGLRDGLSNREQVLVLGGVVMLLALVTTGLVYRYEPRFGAARRTSREDANPSEASESEPEDERSPESAIDRRRSDTSTPLADSERVIQLLEDNDGQLPQSEIVGRTPWSKSKVSRLLTRMSDHDQIVKINAGRQNVIVLPESEPDELKSLRDRNRP